MRTIRLGYGVAALATLFAFATPPSEAQSARRGPPVIQIYSDNGVNYIGTSTYITPRIALSENAYVFAVEMDMDGQIQVLHPDFPGISVRIAANKSLQLPNFFVGFNSSRYRTASSSYADYYGYNSYNDNDSRGTIIALASRVPFNLERIESDGDWDISAIRRLIQYQPPLSAANALASYLGQAGEPIGRDYLRFDGGSRNGYPYYADAYNYYSCGAYSSYAYLPGFVSHQLQALSLFSQLRAQGRGIRLIGFDICGSPIYSAGFVSHGPQTPIGHFPPPHGRGDTTVFPKGRLPRNPVPRPGTVFANADDAGITHGRALPQMGDVNVKAAPAGRRAEPRAFIDNYRPGGGMSVPQGRVPVERVIVPRAGTTGGGINTVQQNRREPLVESAPPRMPERPRESSPPPVIHERPSAPPPPPPRAAQPATSSEPARTPPPSRSNKS